MDTALLTEDRVAVRDVLSSYEQAGVRFHALRTRQAGARKFISLHVLVPGDWTVQRGHQLVERIENDIRNVVLDSTIFTHLERPVSGSPAGWRCDVPEAFTGFGTQRGRFEHPMEISSLSGVGPVRYSKKL